MNIGRKQWDISSQLKCVSLDEEDLKSILNALVIEIKIKRSINVQYKQLKIKNETEKAKSE